MAFDRCPECVADGGADGGADQGSTEPVGEIRCFRRDHAPTGIPCSCSHSSLRRLYRRSGRRRSTVTTSDRLADSAAATISLRVTLRSSKALLTASAISSLVTL